MGADDRKKDGNRNHDDEHETCTTVDLERTLEFGVDKAVVHRGHHKVVYAKLCINRPMQRK